MKKQNLIKLISLVVILSIAVLRSAVTMAATADVTVGTNGPLCNSGGYATPSSVTVSSGDTITFSVPSNDPYAGGVQVNGFPQGSFVVPRGSSVITQTLTANVSYRGTWPNEPSCIKGSGTVTVQAASSSSNPSSSSGGSTSTPSKKTSTSTTSTSSTSTTTPTNATSNNKSSSTASKSAPDTVVATSIVVGNQKVTSDGDLTINQSQPLVLSGTTVPNGTITLTIHSNPITATVQANASGVWSYTVAKLPAGDHTIYATVTNPATKKTSSMSKLLAFTVTTAAGPAVTYSATTTSAAVKKSSSMLPMIIGLIVLLIVIAGLAVVLIKKKISPAASNYASTSGSVTPNSTIKTPANPTVNSQDTENRNPQ